MMYEYIEIHYMSTARKCCVCQKPATHWRYIKVPGSGINKSSKSPVCGEHQPIANIYQEEEGIVSAIKAAVEEIA